MTKDPMTIDELADLLGRPHIKRPQPITVMPVRVSICPLCRNFAHPGAHCKPLERLDNGPILTWRGL